MIVICGRIHSYFVVPFAIWVRVVSEVYIFIDNLIFSVLRRFEFGLPIINEGKTNVFKLDDYQAALHKMNSKKVLNIVTKP